MSAERARLPAVTLALTAACALAAWPALAPALVLEREAVVRGELWRLFTGHLVHGSLGLWLADVAVLAVLCAWVERRSRALLGAVLVAAAAVSSAGLLLGTDLASYVGSSALSSGLLVAAAVSLAFAAERSRSRAVALAALVLFGAKLALDGAGLAPTALAGLPEGLRVEPLAHLLGGLAGGLIALAAAVGARTRVPRRAAEPAG